MDKKHIAKKYEALLHQVATNDYYKVDLTNRINVYTCPKGHITRTKDVDSGTTPFMIRCSCCSEMATSAMYTDIAPNEPIKLEWYRPSLKEVLSTIRKDQGLLDHVLRGGLLSRKITTS